MTKRPGLQPDAGGATAVAVMRDHSTAKAAMARLIAEGSPAADVRIDAAADDIASVRAEMRSEMDNALISPQAAIAWPKEGLKGVAFLSLLASLVVTAVLVPVAFLAAPEAPVVGKLLVAVAVGVLTGCTVALVGGALSTKGPAEPLAAEAGVTLRVLNPTPPVLAILEAFDPIRVDMVLADGTPTGETLTEAPDHSLKVMAARVAHAPKTEAQDRAEQQQARDEGRTPNE